MRKQTYPNQPTDDVLEIIQKLVNFKRQGNFTEANIGYSELASNEKNDAHNYPYILKSWAKVLICLGKYDMAIEYLEQAAKLFRINNNHGENYQCIDQAKKIINRYNNPELFTEYVKAVSGGSLNRPVNY